MKKHHLTWAIAVPLSAAVAGVWAFNLKATLKHAGGTDDFAGIVSSAKETVSTVADGLTEIKSQVTDAAAQVNAKAEDVMTVELLKEKVEAAAAAKVVPEQPNHLQPANDNVNTNAPKKK
jgi:hypothetical protein